MRWLVSQRDFKREAGAALLKLKLPVSCQNAACFNFLVGVAASVVAGKEDQMQDRLVNHATSVASSLANHLGIGFSGDLPDLPKLLLSARQQAEEKPTCDRFDSWKPPS